MSRTRLAVLAAIASLAACTNQAPDAAPASGSGALTTSTWRLKEALYHAAAVQLDDGRVLITGGDTSTSSTADCELWDPETKLWSYTGSLHSILHRHTATRLLDGRVLAAGQSSEVFDPTTASWTVTGPMAEPRVDHTATLLADGRILVVGGFGVASVLASAEIYDPRTNLWAPAGKLATAREGHAAALLDDGRVLVAGGTASDLYTRLSSAEIFDPASGAWSPGASMNAARSAFTLTRLASGRFLAAGGNGGTTGTADLYDPRSPNAWIPTGNLSVPRSLHSAALTPSGDVLLMAGNSNGNTVRSTDRYVESTGRFQPDFFLDGERVYHVTVPLSDGRILLAGGFDRNYSMYLDSVEVVQADPCTPLTCAQMGKTCGVMPNGCNGIVICGLPDGTCPNHEYCANNVCTCHATTCAAQGKTCGTIPDGCGGTLSCGGCGTGLACGVENVCVADTNAFYDPERRAPRCLMPVSACDSGTLLAGRSSLGPEPNAPNTIDGCADGSAGTLGQDESLDRLRVSTVSGQALAAGASVRIDADVRARTTFASDALDLWVAPDAESPRWAWIATLVPDRAGAQTLSTTLTLPRGGTIEAIRGVFRSGGAPAACDGRGSYDDRDDLLIPVAQVPDTVPPSVAFTSPSGPYIGGRVLLALDASDDVAVTRVSVFDGTDLLLTLFQPPWEFTWDTAALRFGGPRPLTAVARDAAGNEQSVTISPILDNLAPLASLVSPAAGATLSQAVVLGATASDENVVSRVEFYDGSALLGAATAPPWSLTWNSAAVPDGTHELSARAYDGAGNVGASAAVAVVVDNCQRTTCAAQGATCGTVSDGCGGTLTCGSCGGGQTCSSHACVCAPTTCAAQGATCGTVSDGCGGTLTCGGCGAGQACAGNTCVCAPTTCAAQGATCGTVSDGCGGTLECGSCPPGGRCSSNGCLPPPANQAAYDGALRVPACRALGVSCDSGSLLVGRAGLGPEPNKPNTLGATCQDGATGTFHRDASIDRVLVSSTGGAVLARGKSLTVSVTLWESTSYAEDRLDLFLAPDATRPSWTRFTTLTPGRSGAVTLTTSFSLPSSASALPAIRAQLRKGGSAVACQTGSRNDHDDLVFAAY